MKLLSEDLNRERKEKLENKRDKKEEERNE